MTLTLHPGRFAPPGSPAGFLVVLVLGVAVSVAGGCATGAIQGSDEGPFDAGSDGSLEVEDAGLVDASPCRDPDATELCNGVDDDCDGSIDEGCDCDDGDRQACYGGPEGTWGVGACTDGVQTCHDGRWGDCEGSVEPTAEVCNGVDDDCDGDEDEDDPGGGDACDTGLTGPCAAGVRHCVAGELACVQDVPAETEVCNGLDDDCDPATADGSEDPDLDVACDGDDSDLCAEGVFSCVGGQLTCSDATSSTTDTCNGRDDDCDPASADGAEDPQVGEPCDGDDGDLCTEGVWQCAGGRLECSDQTTTTVDACNGVDDDCDPASPDGSEDPLAGTSCDGPDTDLCTEGTWSCVNGGLSCSDATGSTVDLCNGANDDCDPASPDGSEDPQFGTPCDGLDSDLCAEGTWECSNGGWSCNDATGSTVDLCNGQNDDCDLASADGSEDPLLGTPCDGPDGDLCQEGVRSCVGGGWSCSDATGTTTEECAGDGADEDCDGQVDEGFVRNDDPACADGVFDLGFVSGDTGAETATDSFYNEEFDLVTITEDSDSLLYLSATIQLFSPPGTDFDLYVYCFSCGGALAGSSTLGGLDGHTDTVEVRRDDTPGVTDDFDLIIEVRHWESNLCADWQLTVSGNTLVTNPTCN